MSLRKIISLLLLVTFFTTSVAPSFAVVTVVTPGQVNDIQAGAGATADGENYDVATVPTIAIDVGAGGDVRFTGGNNGRTFNGLALAVTANGALQLNGSTLTTANAFLVKPPSGTRFVPLTTEGYTAATTTITDDGCPSLTAINATVQQSSGVPMGNGCTGAGEGSFVLASVIEDTPNTGLFGSTGNLGEVGDIVVYLVTMDEGTSEIPSDDFIGDITVTGVGIAATPGATLAADLEATIVTGMIGTLNDAIPSLSGDADFDVATGVTDQDKLEFALVGVDTGNTTGTVEPDNNGALLVASAINGTATTVSFGPGLRTTSGTSPKLDLDALVIRAAETSVSSQSTPVFFQTPFATTEYNVASVSAQNGTTLRNVDLTTSSANTATFPNLANSKITVTFALETTDGSASDASLDLTKVYTSLAGNRVFNGYRNVTTGNGSSAAPVIGAPGVGNVGFLGSVVNVNGSGLTAANTGVGVVYDITGSASQVPTLDWKSLGANNGSDMVGINNSTIPQAVLATATTVDNGNAGFIFPGTIVGNGVNAETTDLVEVNTIDTGDSDQQAAVANLDSGIDNPGDAIFALTEVFAPLTDNAATAWFVATGTGADASNGVVVGPTNIAESIYNLGFDTVGIDAHDNAIAAAELVGNVVSFLPFANKYDGVRDVVIFRPEGTITLGSSSLTNGVKLVATATGNNLPSAGVKVTLAQILPAGELTADISVSASALPAHGAFDSLLQHANGDQSTSRAALSLESISGTATTNDELADILNTSSVLDENTPSLFCGGAVGTSTKGPNGVVFQSRPRAILIQENTADAFSEIQDLSGDIRLRIELPSGVDLNTYDATEENYLNLIGNGSSAFTSAPTITEVSGINGGAAYVDIDLGTNNASSVNTTKRAIALVFKPNALVVPEGTTDFTVTVKVWDETNSANLGTLGTSTLASECSEFLTISYCDSAISTFQDDNSTISNNSVESDLTLNGANLTTFSSVPTTLSRVIKTANTASITLPDICIEEGVADAFPVGDLVDGVPTTFGETATTAFQIQVVTDDPFDSSNSYVFDSVASALVFKNDTSMTAGTPAITDGRLTVALSDADLTASRPLVNKTRIRIKGVTIEDAPNNATPPSQSFLAFGLATDGTDDYAIGSNVVLAYTEGLTVAGVSNTTFVSNTTNSTEADAFAAEFVGSTTNGNTNVVSFDGDATGDTNVAVVVAAGEHDKLTDAVSSVSDGEYVKISEDNESDLIVELADIDGASEKLVTVTAKAGTATAGSIISASTSGSGVNDSVVVPVLSDGGFSFTLRAATTQQITITQTPTSGVNSGLPQIIVIDVSEQNTQPQLVSAAISTPYNVDLPLRGRAALILTVAATGKSNGTPFVPTADDLALGGNPVYAVNGSTNQFIAIVRFKNIPQLTATLPDGSTSSVSLTGLSDITDSPNLVGSPNIFRRKDGKGRIFNTKANRVVVRGARLRNTGTFGLILDDGTFEPVSLRNRTRGDLRNRRRVSPKDNAFPANALFGTFIVPGRGVDSELLNK